MLMRNLMITIEYNGANFSGWQKQQNKRTIQEEMENAFFNLTAEKVEVEASGRTDKGVHAIGQVVSVKTSNKMPVKNFKRALNDLLPNDVFVKKVKEVDDNFHARFSAKRKTYRYDVKVGGDRGAIKNQLMAFYPYEVDLEKMLDASKLLIGKHNFKGLCSADTSVKNFDREIYDVKIKKHGKMFHFYITGSGFLYNMVRIIVGTLLEIGRGKLKKDDLEKAIVLKDRRFAGQTMPPQGLYLLSVEYEK